MAIGETVITIVGNLTADPELRTTGQGAQVASFTIANTARVYNKQTGQYEDGPALFMRCSAWRDMASHCAQSLAKGMRVIAQGRLQQHSYQAQDGTNRTVMELQVDEIGPSLRYATAQVSRISRQPQGPVYGNPAAQTSTPAQAAGANSRRRHSNPPSLRPMIRGARRRTTSHHSEVSARPTRNRISKEQQ